MSRKISGFPENTSLVSDELSVLHLLLRCHHEL